MAKMEAGDFVVPSPKRQRTDSPEIMHTSLSHGATITAETIADSVGSVKSQQPDTLQVQPSSLSSAETSTPSFQSKPSSEQNDMLDTLLQHVEAESTPVMRDNNEAMGGNISRVDSERIHDTKTQETLPPTTSLHSQHKTHDQAQSEDQEMEDDLAAPNGKDQRSEQLQQTVDENNSLPSGIEPASTETIDHLRAVAEVNGLPPTADTLAEQQVPEQREWETDSSPYDSSDTDSSDSSDDTSSDDSADDEEEEAGEGYTMLDAMEQARILMQDAGSDDEGERAANRGGGLGLRTANEKTEEIMPKPDITVTEDMKIEELGHVQSIVEDIVLIQAKTSGEYQVLESGSLLCLQDRKVIGVVSETLGRVEEPLYTVRFGSDKDIQESGVADKGTRIYYVVQHSTFVFTQPLRAVKGSDASNIHDEEVGEHEMEFSDDEAEAEHKRQLKLKRRGIDPSNAPGRGSGRSGRGSHRGRGGYNQGSDASSHAYGTTLDEMNYDDVGEGGADYTPLRRPQNMYGMNGNGGHGTASTASSGPTRGNRGRGQHTARGRGRGNARPSNVPYQSPTQNNVGDGNGDWQNKLSNDLYLLQQAYATRNAQQVQFGQPTPTFNFPTPPAPPSLTPQNPGYSGNGTPTFSPSPISPLPQSQFNFPFFAGSGMFAPGQGQHLSPTAQRNPSSFQPQPPTQYQGNNGGANAASALLVQQHLDELKRTMGSNPAQNNGNGPAS